MDKWLKPNELPEKFHGECWICWESYSTMHEPFLAVVQNHYREGIPEYFSEVYGWRYLSEDYCLMPLEKPEKPE